MGGGGGGGGEYYCFCPSSILYYSKALSSVVHTFEQLYLQDQLANFSQILSVAPLGWGKGCFRFWAKTVVTMATETPIDI